MLACFTLCENGYSALMMLLMFWLYCLE